MTFSNVKMLADVHAQNLKCMASMEMSNAIYAAENRPLPYTDKHLQDMKATTYWSKVDYRVALAQLQYRTEKGKDLCYVGQECATGGWQVYRISREGTSYHYQWTMKTERDAINRIKQIAKMEGTKALLRKMDDDAQTILVSLEAERKILTNETFVVYEGPIRALAYEA